MDIETVELIEKTKLKNTAYKHPDIEFPVFNFTHRELKAKRALWILLHNLSGNSGLKSYVFDVLHKILRRYKKNYDKIELKVLVLFDLIYSSLNAQQKNTLNKILDDLLKANKFNKDLMLNLSLAKLKYYYMDRLNQHQNIEDVKYLQSLLYKKNYINHPKFHYLLLRFQINIEKYFYNIDAQSMPLSIQDYVHKNIDVRFYRLYIKYLDRKNEHFEAVFLIQNLLIEYEGYDESYFYTKKCLKICHKAQIDLPDIFWKNFSIYYLKSKKICENLIKIDKEDNNQFTEEQRNYINCSVVRLLASAPGSPTLWDYFSRELIQNHAIKKYFMNYKHFVLYHVRKILTKHRSYDNSEYACNVIDILQNVVKKYVCHDPSLLKLLGHIRLWVNKTFIC